MNRTQLTLAGLLVLQVALLALLRSPLGGGGAPAGGEALFPGLAEATVTKVQLEQPRDKAQVTLVKGEAGWTVEEAGGFPADAKRVDELLADLRALKARRPVASTSRHHDVFKVEEGDAEGRIRAWDTPAGEPRADLLIGSSTNYRATNVRRAGDDAVFEVRDLAASDVRAEPAAWIDKQLIATDPSTVVGLTLTNARGSFTLDKQDGTWTLRAPEALAGKAADAEQVEQLIRAVTNVRLAEAAGALDPGAQGLDAPAATLVLKTAEQQVEIRVGGSVPGRDSERYITRSGLAFAGTVWESTVRELLEQDAAPLVKS